MDEVENEGSSDVDERMFSESPEFPDLHFPHVRGAGKGWGPRPYATEMQMLQGSRDFVNAIKEKRWTKVNELLKMQVDLDFQNDEGEAPIHLAIAARHEKLVRFLVSYPNHERGDMIDVDATTDEGKTPLHYACAHNSLRLVAILLRCGANVHKITKTDGENALHMAAYHGNIRIAKRLIRLGIDFTCKAKVWGTPLECAKSQGHEEMVQLLESCIERQKRMLESHMNELRAEQRAQFQFYYTGWDTSINSLKLQAAERPASRRKITFMDTGWGDDGLNYCNSINCENCNNPQITTRTYCAECGYALNDTCPGCGVHNLDFEPKCQLCDQVLWAEEHLDDEEEEERPADPYYHEPTGYEEYGDYASPPAGQECLFEERWDEPHLEDGDDPIFYPEWMKKSD